jgi:shikimate kinase
VGAASAFRVGTDTLPVTALLIAGLPGSGKSQFCRWLAQEHDFAHIETDVDPVLNELAAKDLRVVLSAATDLQGRAPKVAVE